MASYTPAVTGSASSTFTRSWHGKFAIPPTQVCKVDHDIDKQNSYRIYDSFGTLKGGNELCHEWTEALGTTGTTFAGTTFVATNGASLIFMGSFTPYRNWWRIFNIHEFLGMVIGYGRLIMKKVLAVLFVLVILVSLQLDQSYARRFMLRAKAEKTDAKPNNQSGNSGTYHNPKTSPEPSTIVANNDNVTDSTDNSNSTDDVNSSYGKLRESIRIIYRDSPYVYQ
ncbi:hypothetical protein Dsin_022844 [Dipteronia sinensis]|uniref:Uncharacterized protein n=1 Tax=Dipteronia sinensis TaxID=43782 RepID=A0AAE0A2G3_9ROSI|nr:hypothetical protein Dsin_022844 [Dipteronia sinensis]